MNDQIHFIQKQKLLLDFQSEEKASAWSKTSSIFYYEEILPLLNQLFNRYIPPDRLYSLDALEIDLGKVSRREFRETLKKKIEAKLHDVLARVRYRDFSSNFQESGGVPRAAGDVIVKGHKEKLLEIFFIFLDHGTFPWNCSIVEIEKLETLLAEQIGIGGLSEVHGFKERMNRALIRKRFYYQFSKPFVKDVFHALFPKQVEIVEFFKAVVTERLDAIPLNAVSKNIVRRIISEDSLAWIIAADAGQPENLSQAVILTVINRIILYLDAKAGSVFHRSVIYEFLRKEQKTNSAFLVHRVITILESDKTYEQKIEEDLPIRRAGKQYSRDSKKNKKEKDNAEGHSPGDAARKDEVFSSYERKDVADDRQSGTSHPNEFTAEHDKGTVNPIASPDAFMQVSKHTGREKAEALQPKTATTSGLKHRESDLSKNTEIIKKPLADEELQSLTEYYVTNAGIILCWPYLNRLFDSLGYLLSASFKTPEARERAIHLLGYIATGEENRGEHELTLSKFITGWLLQMPVGKKIKLLKKEKKQADKMLRSLILNWPILKNTSINGLRSSFFHRDGKLRKENEGWRLIVEQKSYDMLLDHLPYSIAIIKLPWNKEILRVDWAS